MVAPTLAMLRTICVVGGGLAGLTATIEAHRSHPHARVILLEKQPRVGGNSAKASSGMNACLTDLQRARNISDTTTAFAADTTASGHGLSDPDLVRVLTESSLNALRFIESFGVNLNAVSRCGGHSHPRTHRIASTNDGKVPAVGYEIIKALQTHIASLDRVEVINDARLMNILRDMEGGNNGGPVTGLRYECDSKEHEITTDAVILATGGFANDHTSNSLILSHAPHLVAMPTTNGEWATGDGVKMGLDIGARAVDLDKIQIHPTGFVDPKHPSLSVKFLAPEALRAHGAILIEQRTSSRFTNELATRDVVSQSILNLPDRRRVLMFFNDHTAVAYGSGAIDFYIAKGLVMRHSDLEKACASLGLSFATVKDVLHDYSEAADTGSDEFGKTVFPTKISPSEPIYVAEITPVIHYTMGGLKIDTKARVLDSQSGLPIPGLYGAGEVTGGVHGFNRLAGNSLLECVVFGRIAGAEALSHLSNHYQ